MSSTSSFANPRLRTIIRTTVREELLELLEDPDFGLILRTAVRRRLLKSQKARKVGRLVSADEVMKRLDLRL